MTVKSLACGAEAPSNPLPRSARRVPPETGTIEGLTLVTVACEEYVKLFWPANAIPFASNRTRSSAENETAVDDPEGRRGDRQEKASTVDSGATSPSTTVSPKRQNGTIESAGNPEPAAAANASDEVKTRTSVPPRTDPEAGTIFSTASSATTSMPSPRDGLRVSGTRLNPTPFGETETASRVGKAGRRRAHSARASESTTAATGSKEPNRHMREGAVENPRPLTRIITVELTTTVGGET